MRADSTVAVTGATGFTGSVLAKRLAADGYTVRALARNVERLPAHPDIVPVPGELGDETALDTMVSGVDTVFHIAAMYRSEGSYEEFLAVNYQGTRALVAACRRAGVRRFIYCSTIGVHGSVAHSPADESASFSPRDPYQETKLLAEQFCAAEMAIPGLEIVIIRPCGIYGPGDTRMLKMFQMVNKGIFFLVGNGAANFHPVYVDDLVQGFILAMETPQAAGQTYIIGDANYLPLRDYVGTAARALGKKPPRIRLPYGPLNLLAHASETAFGAVGMQPPLHRRRLTFFKHNRAFSIDKARAELGYQPAVDLQEGFRRTVAWYRETGLLPSD